MSIFSSTAAIFMVNNQTSDFFLFGQEFGTVLLHRNSTRVLKAHFPDLFIFFSFFRIVRGGGLLSDNQAKCVHNLVINGI